MVKNFEATNYQTGKSKTVSADLIKKCPLCHTGFNGEIIKAFLIPCSGSGPLLYVLHFCFACESGFLGIYNDSFP